MARLQSGNIIILESCLWNSVPLDTTDLVAYRLQDHQTKSSNDPMPLVWQGFFSFFYKLKKHLTLKLEMFQVKVKVRNNGCNGEFSTRSTYMWNENNYYALLYQSNSHNDTKQTFAFDLETWNTEGQGQQQELQLKVLIQSFLKEKALSFRGRGLIHF